MTQEEILEQLLKGQQAILIELDGVKVQVRENTDILKAVLHNQEVARAEIEGLKNTSTSLVPSSPHQKKEILHSCDLQK